MLISEMRPGQKFTDCEGDSCVFKGVDKDRGLIGWCFTPGYLGWAGPSAYWGNKEVRLGWSTLPDLPPEAQALVDAFERGEET